MLNECIERVVTERDIYDLLEYFKKFDFDNKECFYLVPYVTKEAFNEFVLRDELFNYTVFAFAAFDGNKIKKLAYYQLPNITSKLKSIELRFLAMNEQDGIDQFLLNSMEAAKNHLKNYTKIKVPVYESVDNAHIVKLLNLMGFEKEITFNDDLGENTQVSIYAYWLNE